MALIRLSSQPPFLEVLFTPASYGLRGWILKATLLFCESVFLMPLSSQQVWSKIEEKKRDPIVWVPKKVKIIKT